ncbi:Cytochrome P450 84A1 [Acorus calamus]|uniref:Cytochrome P450 84A1 n=1 Tax=Acorus calamus TaxID=4465 RepID=A0AAV9D2Y4_ACOCL|nr:Cytochrome P450 84A1 [Acorus calamus]
MLGNLPHRALRNLAAVHGPIMHLRLGFTDAIIITSPSAARLVLRTHDEKLASRAYNEAARHFSHGGRDIATAEYGPHWRAARKLCTLHLLSRKKVDSFRSLRVEELRDLVRDLRARQRAQVDLSEALCALNARMMCRTVFGQRRYMECGLEEAVREFTEVILAFNIANYVPFIGALDLQGLRRRMRTVGERLDAFIGRIIDDHMETDDDGLKKDFIGTMLSLVGSGEADFRIDRTTITALAMDMLVGGMDTSATVAEWAMSELMRHPNVMNEAREELARVVGVERMVTEEDLASLPYLKKVIKECLRMHPPSPLLMHASTEECVIGGYRVPEKARVIVNVWAIMRDPEVWVDPERFDPERFNVDRDDDFGYLPFGSGRRGCPGREMGLTWFSLVVAQLLHCFEWELAEGVEKEGLDMTERFGLTAPRATPLWAVPSYRLLCEC